MSLAGRTISHYRIVEEISRGGMGIVYRATDTRLNRDVALKVLPSELTNDPERRERFTREARAASALEHPNIAVIYDIGEEDGVSFIAMELVRGDKLSVAINTGALLKNPARALDVAVEVAEALARAHIQGIVHRDLKPANVMLTEEGHAKVIDFGLAKLVAPPAGGGDTVTMEATNPQVVLGTVSYMSPEQARGGSIDHRTDIFSFGILLYELFSGMLPFRGQSSIETMHAILYDPAPPVRMQGLAMPAAVVDDVQRIIDKCLAKDPDDRYQGMKDLAVDLRAARRRMDSDASVAAVRREPAEAVAPARTSGWLIGAGALVLLLVVAGYWIWNTQRAPIAQASGSRPSVAVMYFENNTGDQNLDWLRTGLTDMLVTDLSQSPDVEVLSTDRLVQILGSLKKLDDRQISFDTVQEVARRAGVQHVMLGSYLKAGEQIRINLKLQDAATGKIISTERVDAANEAGLFPIMDELTRRLKQQFALPSGGSLSSLLSRPGSGGNGSSLDRDLKDVTTSSVDAYRAYAAGVEQHQRARYRDAIPHYLEAVKIDPDFALAYLKLAVVTSNIGLSNERDANAKKALDLSDRLTPRERYYIEGFYYSSKAETMGRAIDAYEKALALYPDHSASRNNVATLYMRSDQPDKAIAHLEVLRQRGFDFPGTALNLAGSYIAANRPEDGVRVVREFAERFPNLEAALANLGAIEMSVDRTDAAQQTLERAYKLQPEFAATLGSLAYIAQLREDDAGVERYSQPLLKFPNPTTRGIAHYAFAATAIKKGNAREALRQMQIFVDEQPSSGSIESALARVVIAEILMAQNRTADAAAEAKRAVADARGRLAIADALFVGVLAGLPTARTELEDAVRPLPHGVDKALPLLADAILSVKAGQNTDALDLLQRFENGLPPGAIGAGSLIPVRQPRTQLAYWRGQAQLATGHLNEAAKNMGFVADAKYMRLFMPIEYVRSHYYMGQIAEKQGDAVKAREHYARFLKYWKDGELDRDKVAYALKNIGS